MQAVSHITWPKAYAGFNCVSFISLVLLKVMELCCFFLRQLASLPCKPMQPFMASQEAFQKVKYPRTVTDAVSLGKFHKKHPMFWFLWRQKKLEQLPASFLIGSFALSEDMEVGSEDVEGIFLSLCCVIFISKYRVSFFDVHVSFHYKKKKAYCCLLFSISISSFANTLVLPSFRCSTIMYRHSCTGSWLYTRKIKL